MSEIFQTIIDLWETHLTLWVAIGLLGQAMFTMRFLYQWVYSERVGKSVVPEAFWYFSMAGGAILLAYAIYRKDPVFILGQGTGLLIYTRNIYFIWREKFRLRAA
ncbi:MAG: lipid A biosynthesis [Alphaproteobacteria bacterium]|nr:lipid A biosynthesis [Alphaproteobacteria bacterium]